MTQQGLCEHVNDSISWNARNPASLLPACDSFAIADRVIAYAAPTSYTIYDCEKYRWNWDTTSLIRSALEQCRTIKRVTCEDLPDAVPIQHFIDVLHLRPEGQKVLASSLHRLIDLRQFRSSRKDNF
ncbi:hypothetical protein [Polaromonas sp. UC242_47]|uniref:hypothetical protein n=1 Tax=Polaromonas sp. UC242_47 TaxID=3374626 RepID=UPI0037B8A0F6